MAIIADKSPGGNPIKKKMKTLSVFEKGIIIFSAAMTVIIAVLLVIQGVRPQLDNVSLVIDETSPEYTVSINSSGLEALTSLDGIGEKLAQAIIDYRSENGGFDSLEEIMEVPGIGEKKYAGIKDHITLD